MKYLRSHDFSQSPIRIAASVLAVSLLFIHPPASAKLKTPGQILTAQDDHTATALKRASQAEALKKITAKAPTATPAPSQHPGLETTEDIGTPITKPVVNIEPAPGTHSETEAAAEPALAQPETPSAHLEAAAQAKPPTVTAVAPVAETTAAVAKATSSHAKEDSSSVSADLSLRWLTNGNNRYVTKHFRADGRTAEDRKRLLSGQKPHAIVLSCSDSRVPPEIVFDQVPGEVFVIRVAGEALDSAVIASVEYAVDHLGSKLLVVMGHTQCGAISTALSLKEGSSAGSESLDKLLADIRPRLKTVSTEKPSANLEIESTVNADGVARDLVRRSELIRKKVEAGELVIKPALYRMDSGKVSFY